MKFSFWKRSRVPAIVAPEPIQMDGQVPDGMPPSAPQKKAKKKIGFSFGSKRARFNDGVVQVGVELENERKLYFSVTAGGEFIRLGNTPDASAPLVTAYRNDWRVPTPGAMSDAKAKGFASRETDALERMASINESRRGRIYSTQLADLEPGELRMPLLQVLEAMIGDRKGQFVAGVLLGKQDLAILYAYNEGVMGAKQLLVSVNPENLQSIASSFVSMSGMPEEADVIVFEQAEFLQKLMTKSWTPYPASHGFYGIPKGAIPAVMVGVAGVAALSGCGYAGYWYFQEARVKGQLEAHTKNRAALVSSIGDEISARYGSFVEGTSVDVLRATDIAAKLRTDSAVVEATLTRNSFDYLVLTEFFATEEIGDGERFRGALSHEPIEGCVKQSIETTGGMREIKIKYSCPVVGANSARFGW